MRAQKILAAVRRRGFVDLRMAAQACNERPYNSRKDPLVEDIVHYQAIYRMMERLVERGLVARVLHMRPVEWHEVHWKGGTPSIDASKGRVWRMCSRHMGQPYYIRVKRQTWKLPNPVVGIQPAI